MQIMRKMKDSGIEWIGEIPEGWEVAPLKRFASIQTGNTPTKTSDSNYYASTGIPWIKPDNLGYSHSISKTSEYLTSEGALCARIMPPNTVYVCCIGSLGKVGYSSISCACNQQINALIFNDLMFWKYGYYLTIAQESQYLLFGNGNVLQIINSTSQGNIACVLPPLENQHLIACYLDSVCSDTEVLISKTRSSIEEYKKLKQAVITQAVTKGVRGKREMKDSGVEWIGEIPVDWEISRIKYVSIFEPSCDFRKLTPETIITYSPMECIKNGTFERRTSLYGNLAHTLTPFQNGDIVMAKVTPCFENGNIAIMNELQSGYGLGSSELFVFRPQNINTRYLFYWLQNKLFVHQACATMTGTGGLKRISPSFVKNCNIHYPSTAEQAQIAAYLDTKCAEIDKLIAKKEQLVKELESYKKSLIYEVVTGKREV